MTEQSTRTPLAIIGAACRFPGADDRGRYWANILNAEDCISDIPASHWRVDEYYDADPKSPDRTYAKRGGFLSPAPFNPLTFGVPPTAIEATDTSQLIGMMVAKEALDDAGYGQDRVFNRDRVGVILGVTGALELVVPLGARLGHPLWRKALDEAGVDKAVAESVIDKIAGGYVGWQEQSFPGLLGNVVAGRIANYLNLGGTNCVVDAACASALSALHLATLELQSGRADMVITGGVDTFNDIFMYMCFSKTPALSPSGDVRPFDRDGDGTLLGEGVGMVALKRLADAERDGDRIYAVLKGIGSSSDGKGNAIYAPNAAGQAKALRRAYREADVDPATVEMVEGHGTGTKVGDATEVGALTSVFGGDGAARRCVLGSVKSQIGHTKAAAGVAGLIKAVFALKNKVLPPSLKVRNPLDVLGQDSPFYILPHAKPWIANGRHPRRAGVSAFGFGGSNFHCVLEEYEREKSVVDWDGDVQILAFSANQRDALRAELVRLDAGQDWAQFVRTAARSRLSFDAAQSFRLIFLVDRHKYDLNGLVQRVLSLFDGDESRESWSAPEGVYFGSGPRDGKLGVLFPGQGSQYTGMLRDLACRFPQMQSVLTDVNLAFAESGDSDETLLSDLIYPPPAYDSSVKKSQETILRETQNAQPAIGAVSIGALKILNYLGVEPESAAGHSYGEITALCASERFDAEALYLLSRLRGKLMAKESGDRGGMLAVRAGESQVESIVAEHGLDLVLANKNAPDQIVLSGSTAEIEKAANILSEVGVSNKRLPVAAAFHSTLVAQAAEPFFEKLRAIEFPSPRFPVFANTTGLPYPDDPEGARDLLANQLTHPVEFVDEIRNMHKEGTRFFLEVGPGARLTGLVKSILDGETFHAVAVDGSSGKKKGVHDLARVMAALAAWGFPVRLDLWEDSEAHSREPEPVKGMIIPLTGANYRDPNKRKAEAKMQRPVKPSQPIEKVETRPVIASSESAPELDNAANASSPSQSHEASRAAAAMPKNQLAEAIRVSQQNLIALQKMQQETADLHRRFLEGQDASQTRISMLMDRQQRFLEHNQASTAYPQTTDPRPTAKQTPREEVIPAGSGFAKTSAKPVAVKTGAGPDRGDLRAGSTRFVPNRG